ASGTRGGDAARPWRVGSASAHPANARPTPHGVFPAAIALRNLRQSIPGGAWDSHQQERKFMKHTRRTFTKTLSAIGIAVGALGLSGLAQAADTIKVGILHSLSGTMAISETVLKDVALMTIDEINAKGGVLGKKLEPV